MKRTIFLMLAVLLSALSASAYAFKVDGIAYNKNGDGKSVYVAYGGDYTGPVTIPERVTYDGATYSVTTIGDYAFSDCTGLTSVTIPSSVNSIGEEAFRGCTGLTSVTIPTSVTEIGYSAFGGTPWYNNQPDGVVYIGKVAYEFKGEMASGTAINIKEGTVSISGYAFYGCTGLTSITIPNSVTSIGEFAFSGWTGLTSVTIPSSVTSIGKSAFSGCTGLTSVTIPNSVTEIGWSAFRGCAGLTSVTIPNSVTEIGWSAFEGCTALTSVTFNATNCKSPDRTYEAWFQDCPLTSLVIGNDVKSIPSCLAYYQTRLTTVTIPNSVTEIGDMAFEGCTGLKKIYSLNPVPPVIYEGTFETYHTDLFVPKGCYLKYKEAEYWKNFTFISEINVETGDIDGDGEINVGDVTAHINKLLNAASYDDAVCDINGDGEVNVTDVTSLINMILE